MKERMTKMIRILEKWTDQIHLIVLKSEELEVHVTNYGCTIVKVLMKDREGNVDDVVLGYDSLEEYQKHDGYLGALVGRVANRIKKGHFVLNGKAYQLAINNGPNHLHGGIKGFSMQTFDYEILNDHSIAFTYYSKDGEENYPGNVKFRATYTLEKDTLKVNYEATTDQDTLMNITNHSYFNLSGKKENIMHHTLQVKADQFGAVDEDGLTTGNLIAVEGTPFDLNVPKYLEDCFNQTHEQLTIGRGFDHPFIFNRDHDQVILRDEKSGRELIVSTTLPGAQIYSANYLDGRLGKYGMHYYEKDGICIETQYFPDAIHLEKEPAVILKKGETYQAQTTYKFVVK